MLGLHTLRLDVTLIAVAALSGCPGTDPIQPPPAPTDVGGTNSLTDAGTQVREVEPTNAITAGGGTGENEDYKVRIIIGGPTAVGADSNTANSVKIGAGAAQNGQ